MPGDPYDLFAHVYDAWQAGYPKPFSEAVFPFYEREILRRGVPRLSLADFACGTGTFLRLWAARHPAWSLAGTDQSSPMLKLARSKLTTAGIKARLLRQSLQQVCLPEPVGAAVCVFDSLNHLLRLYDLRRCFRSVARGLLPGGLFLFDLNEERAFSRLFSGAWSVESRGLYVSAQASTSSDARIGTIHFTTFRQAGRTWKRNNFDIKERNWRSPEVRSCLAASGLIVLRVRIVQPYPPAEVEAPRTLWVCRKPDPRSGGRNRETSDA